MKAPFLVPTALLLTAACGDTKMAGGEAPSGVQSGEERVDCAPAGAGDFQRDCTIERLQGAEGTILTVRHPDGGFRRLLVTADGVEQAVVTPLGTGMIEVAIGNNRYRLPATVKP